jgi:LPS sulfotransferase NodH
MPLAYVICTSPRTGSTLLCRGLANTGRAGAPDEFFDRPAENLAYWMRRFAISNQSEFASKIIDATSTPNGVFGVKLHWTAYPDMHQAFADSLTPRLVDARNRSLNELLHERFSMVRYIWLRRLDKVAQGISHFRAVRSGLWEIPRGQHAAKSGVGESLEFDFQAIDHCVAWAAEYDRQWRHHFRRQALTPLEIVYEAFVDSYDPTLRKILDYLGVSHADLPTAEPQLERMADRQSLEWETQYSEMKLERPDCQTGDEA